jgi:methionyl-tRNA formyltransferase
MDVRIQFLGTSDFAQVVLEKLKKRFTIVDSNPDLIVVASYGKILPKEQIETPKYGALNVHPSLLPKYRGPSPLQAAILNGDRVSGVTILKLDEQMDHGPILAKKEVELSEDETFDSWSKKGFEIGAEMLVDLIPDYISGKLSPTSQDDTQATYCKLVKKEDGYFEIDKVPENLDRMIRAYYPWPGAWTKWNGKVVKFLPGGQVQMEGKKATDLKSFLNGYPDFPIKEL